MRLGQGVTEAGQDDNGQRLMRVLLIGRGLGLGGMEQLLLAQVRSGDRGRFEYSVAYVNADKDALVPEFEALDIAVHDLAGARGPWPVAIRQLLARERFDVVHAHSPLVAAAVRLVSRTIRPRPKLVYTEHNSWHPYSVVTRWANRLTYRMDDRQFAVSRAAWESVPEGLRDELEVLSHGIDVAAVGSQLRLRLDSRREMGIGPDELAVGTVANFRPEKNYEGLLRVAQQMTSVDPHVRFVSIGQGPLADDIGATHRQLGLGDRFMIMGAQPDAIGLMAGFDVFTLASHVEGLPVAFMEARALGIPVVVTAVGGLPDLITDIEDGFLVPPGSDDALAEALRIVTTSGAERQRLSIASAIRAHDCNASRATSIIETHYSEALANNQGGHNVDTRMD